jgi:hypothetical protein
LFDFDHPSEVANYVPAVLAMARNPAAARAKIVNARKFVEQRQRETMKILRKSVGAVREPPLQSNGRYTWGCGFSQLA